MACLPTGIIRQISHPGHYRRPQKVLCFAGGLLRNRHVNAKNIHKKRFYDFMLFGNSTGLCLPLLGKRDITIRPVMHQTLFSQQFQGPRNRRPGNPQRSGNIFAAGRT